MWNDLPINVRSAQSLSLLVEKLFCSFFNPAILDRVNFQKMLTLKANRVNLGHINFLGVLRGAELKYSVCPAQKCPQMPQN